MEMGILALLVFGAIAGWLASIIAGSNARTGLISNIIIGIAGAFIGSYIAQLLGYGGVGGFNLRSMVVAVIGSVLLLLVLNLFRRR
jgi:uncharacterized membrane protein YeaQ/YmgE (transglycosylase-associated protein family)